ncbi:MAG: bifunctional metallophosphatase/5'-nucleotidase [Oscillospiraceae bacterium]|nr:bifunctional metallophosphatase/5'-nucleotidase [Oscillospiraceae bacterium]
MDSKPATGRRLTIFYTSDIHGCFSPVSYSTGTPADTGLCNCAANFTRDGNTLIIDGGDTLQGSPFTYWLYSRSRERSAVPAKLMNLAGYDFITLGNHDFNYGVREIESYLSRLKARCLCANVSGILGLEKSAVVTLENGLRVGLTGVTSHFVPRWEKPENIAGLEFRDAFAAAQESLHELKEQQVDLTVCIYHGGFENDTESGAPLSDSGENQGWRICRELDYDILLTGHQHMPLAGKRIADTAVCQPPDKARQYIRMDVCVDSDGRSRTESHLCPAGSVSQPEMAGFLRVLNEQTDAFLDAPLGHLDRPLPPASPLESALNGSLIANFFNQVQLAASGADVSVTCLGEGIRGFSRDVTVRDITASYLFPNTLKTILVDKAVLKAALERCAAYFSLNADGLPCVSDDFLRPVPQHYNFDYFSNLEADVDIRRPCGDRVLSIRWQGRELDGDLKLSLCLNNYRAAGSGGYPFYADCPVLREQPEEISELIIRYVDERHCIAVDPSQWMHVFY